MVQEHEKPLLAAASLNSRTSRDEDEIGPINGIRDFFREYAIESKKLWYLAGPASFTYVSQYTIGASTQIFAGQLGTIQLAAISVENSVVSKFGYGILMGMGCALETFCGQAFGANQLDLLGIYLQRSWFILHVAAIAIMFLFVFFTPILKFLGQSAAISKEAGKFAIWMIPQLFSYAMMIPLSKYLQAQRKVLEMALISAIGLCLHAFLSWLIIMELGWGLPGAAVVLNSSWWFIALALFFYVIAGYCGPAWSGFSWKAFKHLSEYVKLSLSSALMLSVEVWYSMALILVAGHLKAAEVSVDAISICVNILGWSSMVGFGFNAAISVRVSNELGSGHPRAAKFSALVAGLTSSLIGLLFSLTLLLERDHFPEIFSNSTQVKQLVKELTPSLAVNVVFVCLQFTLQGVATGAGWQKFVAYLNTASYFLFGVPMGILMCYKFYMGVKGLWWGILLGLCLQTIILSVVICLTNWEKEVSTAEERLKHSGGKPQAQKAKQHELDSDITQSY